MPMTRDEATLAVARDILADPEWTARVVVAAIVSEEILERGGPAHQVLSNALTESKEQTCRRLGHDWFCALCPVPGGQHAEGCTSTVMTCHRCHTLRRDTAEGRSYAFPADYVAKT